MKTVLTIFVASVCFCFAAHAVEVELPNNAGHVNITNGVVRVPGGTKIADGEYRVIVENKEVTIIFVNGKGFIK